MSILMTNTDCVLAFLFVGAGLLMLWLMGWGAVEALRLMHRSRDLMNDTTVLFYRVCQQRDEARAAHLSANADVERLRGELQGASGCRSTMRPTTTTTSRPMTGTRRMTLLAVSAICPRTLTGPSIAKHGTGRILAGPGR